MRAAICWRRCPRRPPSPTTARRTRRSRSSISSPSASTITWTEAVKRHGESDFRRSPASVPDAKAFSAEMEKAGAGQYENVRVTLALDEDATSAKLDEAVSEDRQRDQPARHLRALRRGAWLFRLAAIIT